MTSPLHLLLVEDDELDRIAVRRALRKTDLGFELAEAETASAAVAAFDNAAFDCVILDYQLPDGNAVSLLHRLESLPSQRPPVIILTGYGSESVAVELMKAGASDYLPKDELTPSRIAQSLRNAIRVWKSEQALRRAYGELEHRVVERTADLETALAALEEQIADREHAEEQARRLHDQLAHVARFSTLGEMAAGLAHELNQPLGAISNYASGCIQRLRAGNADEEKLIAALSKIAAQAQRAGQIIHRLRSFVADRESEKIAADVNGLVEEVVDLEGSEARQREVDLELELAADLPQVLADTIQIQQVILNLLRNGIEAMHETEASRRRIVLRTRLLGGAVEVAVADRGCGYADIDSDRFFDAFFTTKDHGMGLGLTISRSIIEAHGGELGAAPNPGGGAVFHFTLPVIESEA